MTDEDKEKPSARLLGTLKVFERCSAIIARDDSRGPLSVEYLAGTLRGGCHAYLAGMWKDQRYFTSTDLVMLASLALELARELELMAGHDDVGVTFFRDGEPEPGKDSPS